jgi:hypothetical protein
MAAHDAARRGLMQIVVERFHGRRRRMHQHHALAQRRVPFFWQQGRSPHAGHIGCQCQRVGNDAALGIAGRRELRCLRHIFTEYQRALQGFPESGVAQHLLGACPIGCVFRIGYGEAADLPSRHGVAQPGKG